jgi:hypothetical protein
MSTETYAGRSQDDRAAARDGKPARAQEAGRYDGR